MLTLGKNYYISTALPTHKQQAMDTALFKHLLTQTESETLDFKREFPALPTDMAKSEFIKDIIAFYNTPRTEDAYIIYGVEDNNGVAVLPPRGLAIQAPYDEANLQQLVKDKVSPIYNPLNKLGKFVAAISL